jgi:hypothetical protein
LHTDRSPSNKVVINWTFDEQIMVNMEKRLQKQNHQVGYPEAKAHLIIMLLQNKGISTKEAVELTYWIIKQHLAAY